MLRILYTATFTAFPFILAIPGFGQTEIAGPRFEAASVKRSAALASDLSARGGRPLVMKGGPGTSSPGQLHYVGVTLTSVIDIAYEIKPYQLSGPDWLNADRFDVEARVPEGASRADFARMLQNLLAERFHAETHVEKRDVQGYRIALSKATNKLTPSKERANGQQAAVGTNGSEAKPIMRVGGGGNNFHVTATAQSIKALAKLLEDQMQMPVVDATGLDGTYDFVLAYSIDETASFDATVPFVGTAVERQLGLRFQRAKLPTKQLVIDRIDRQPSAN